ncbi:MAG: erythromycin esterase family protein [Anaerolineae bacterium]|nr:erythromycin esterase family protein [Anaerolineae bacterium]
MTMNPAPLDHWIQHDAIPFSADSSDAFHAAVDQVVTSLGDAVELLGFGEALHGGEDILMFRNRLFQRLAEAHGYSAIAIESSFPKGRAANDYVAGRGPDSYDAVQDTGFSHGFGQLAANRELLEWMRRTNADSSHAVKLRFYGFDMPLLRATYASPRQVLEFVLDYLDAGDDPGSPERRQRIDSLLGPDFDWENPEAIADPTKSVGLSPAAAALRIETEDLITELRSRRPEFAARSSPDRYAEALHHAVLARQLLGYHAGVARRLDASALLGIRDASMADNLAYIVERERGRGKVMAFAHNSHVQRGKAVWPWYAFWPVGSHLKELFGPRYAVIGSAVGVSEANGIGQPEAGSLEARLMNLPGSAAFIPTHQGQGIPGSEIDALPVRAGSARNLSYKGLTAQSFTDFDWLAFLDSTAYSRGGPPLP